MPKNLDKEKNSKKPIDKKHIIISVSITVLCLALGGVGGYFIGKMFFPKNEIIDYSKLKDVDFEDDQEALMKKYALSKSSDYSKDFAPYEIVNIGINKIKEHKYVETKTYGQVNAMGVEQSVRATSIKNEDNYFMENISTSSAVQTGKRFYQSGETIKTYNGSNVSTERADWPETAESELSLEEHEAKWGKQLSRPIIYIISSKTAFETSTATKTDDGYVVRLDLSPKYSILRYVRQMVEISPISDPVFHSVQFTVTLDKDLNIISTEADESYSVTMVVSVESVGHIKDYYTYDVETPIPSLNQDLEYLKGE